MMKRFRGTMKIACSASIAAVAVFGLSALSSDAEAQPEGWCVCPHVYAPVKCDNGQTYSNQCFADCAGATGCEPIGPGPIPFPY